LRHSKEPDGSCLHRWGSMVKGHSSSVKTSWARPMPRPSNPTPITTRTSHRPRHGRRKSRGTTSSAQWGSMSSMATWYATRRAPTSLWPSRSRGTTGLAAGLRDGRVRGDVGGREPSSQVKSRFISPNDTQAKYTEQSATYVPLWSTGTQGASCRKRQAGRE